MFSSLFRLSSFVVVSLDLFLVFSLMLCAPHSLFISLLPSLPPPPPTRFCICSKRLLISSHLLDHIYIHLNFVLFCFISSFSFFVSSSFLFDLLLLLFLFHLEETVLLTADSLPAIPLSSPPSPPPPRCLQQDISIIPTILVLDMLPLPSRSSFYPLPHKMQIGAPPLS